MLRVSHDDTRPDPATICAVQCSGRSLIVEIRLQRDDGSMTVLTGYRVRHSNALGPAKGGTRFRPGLQLDDVTYSHGIGGRRAYRRVVYR